MVHRHSEKCHRGWQPQNSSLFLSVVGAVCILASSPASAALAEPVRHIRSGISPQSIADPDQKSAHHRRVNFLRPNSNSAEQTLRQPNTASFYGLPLSRELKQEPNKGDKKEDDKKDKLNCDKDQVKWEVSVFTDEWSAETSWDIRTLDDPKKVVFEVSKNKLKPSKGDTKSGCVEDDECYVFTIKDTEGDGICCNYGEGRYAVMYDEEVVGTGGKFKDSETVTFGDCPKTTESPTTPPTLSPTTSPSLSPTILPTASPTTSPSLSPTTSPSKSPTTSPSKSPTTSPSTEPTLLPTEENSEEEDTGKNTEEESSGTVTSASPSLEGTSPPTSSPTTELITTLPTSEPTTTSSYTTEPTTTSPTSEPTTTSLSTTTQPTPSSTTEPTLSSTSQLTITSSPSVQPTSTPSTQPITTSSPTVKPTTTGHSSTTSSSASSSTPSTVPTPEPSSPPSTKPSFKPSLSPSSEPSLQPSTIPTLAPTTIPLVTAKLSLAMSRSSDGNVIMVSASKKANIPSNSQHINAVIKAVSEVLSAKTDYIIDEGNGISAQVVDATTLIADKTLSSMSESNTTAMDQETVSTLDDIGIEWFDASVVYNVKYKDGSVSDDGNRQRHRALVDATLEDITNIVNSAISDSIEDGMLEELLKLSEPNIQSVAKVGDTRKASLVIIEDFVENTIRPANAASIFSDPLNTATFDGSRLAGIIIFVATLFVCLCVHFTAMRRREFRRMESKWGNFLSSEDGVDGFLSTGLVVQSHTGIPEEPIEEKCVPKTQDHELVPTVFELEEQGYDGSLLKGGFQKNQSMTRHEPQTKNGIS